MIRLVGGADSDVGQVRSNNQDAALADPVAAVYAVADGMGGHRGGEVASAMALSTLSRQLRELTRGDPLGSAEVLVDAVLGANEAVFEQAQGNAELFGMGTTLCAVALVGGRGHEQVAVVNVGDSRVYLQRAGELTQLTEDHSLVQGLVRDGQLSADEAAVHPQRNILTRVVGVEPDVEVDWWEWPAVIGDRYLLCSDGLFNEVSDAAIATVLEQRRDPADAARALVAMANAGGGRDNVTCVVVDVAAVEPETTLASPDEQGVAAVPSRPTGAAPATGATAAVPGAAMLTVGSGVAATQPSSDTGGAVGHATGPSSEPATAAVQHLVGDGTGPAAPAEPSGHAGQVAPAGLPDPGPTAAAELAGYLTEPPPPEEPAPRRLTLRVVAFLLGLVVLAGAAVFTIRLWANHNYFVAASDGRVAIFQGRPDGVLWFDPEVVELTDLRVETLTSRQKALLDDQYATSSRDEARRWIDAQLAPEAAVTTSTTIGGGSTSRPTTTSSLATTSSTATMPTVTVPDVPAVTAPTVAVEVPTAPAEPAPTTVPPG